MKNLNTMSREEVILSHQVNMSKEIDPLYLDRLQFHLGATRTKLKHALTEVMCSPEEIEALDKKIRHYGKLLSVALKMNVVELTKEDAFAEANITAQKEEAEKQLDDAI